MDNYISDDEILEFKASVVFERYYNPDTMWGVYNFSTTDDIPYYVSNNNTLIDPFNNQKDNPAEEKKFSSLAGKMQELIVGGEYLVKAKYKYDKTYGHQYVPIAVYSQVPQTTETQFILLKSLTSANVASNLIEAYPNIVEDIVNGRLEDIDCNKVKGVGSKTWEKLKDKIINNYLISDIIVMLKPIGVTYTMIKKLLSDEPNPMLLKQKLNDNPYILTQINGLGFKRVDELALKLKPNLLNSYERICAFIKYYFVDIGETDGHTWCSVDILKAAVSNNVSECINKFNDILGNNDFLYVSDDKVGLKYYHDIEIKILNIILDKSKKDTTIKLTDEQINKAIKEAEEEQGFEYTTEQSDAITKSLNRTVSIISGKAGTGKSSIMRAIIKAYNNNHYTITASALSAMAANRITEATGFPAMTIHRTLGCKGLNQFTFTKDCPLITNVALLDEGSMVNASLFLHWLEAIDDNTKIVISGDHKQLPPIGYGNVFSDLISVLGSSIKNELTKPMRQALKSGILSDANLIRENKNPITENIEPKLIHGELKDMYYMFRNNRQSLADIAIKTYLKSIERYGIENVIIAVPRKKDCINSTGELNKIIQDKILKDEPLYIENYGTKYKLGAKVVQTVNDYDNNVFNGEIGYIIEIGKRDKEGSKDKKEEYCKVTYKDIFGKEKIITYIKKDLNSLDLAYAMTVHRLQGSGYKIVIGIIDNTHYQLLDNCMLYTLLTRAKERCLLLAEPQAFSKCLHTSSNKRNTWIMLEKQLKKK